MLSENYKEYSYATVDKKLKDVEQMFFKCTVVQSSVIYTHFAHPCAFLISVSVSLSSSKSLSLYCDIFQLIL